MLILLMLARSLLILLSLSVPLIYSVPVVCYYVLNQPEISKVPVDLCSHIILINSAHIEENSGVLKLDTQDLDEFSQLLDKKKDVKLLMSITSSNPSFSHLTADNDLMEQFAKDLVAQISKFGLHGVDIDWEFPAWSHDAKSVDRKNFGAFLNILKTHLSPHNLLLSVAVSGPPTITKKAYDVKALDRYADMVQIMNYDFHVFNKFTNPLVGFNAPLRPMTAEISVLGKMNVEASMTTWQNLGLSKNKTFFGIPTYARGYQLLTPYLHKPYSPAIRTRPEYTNYNDVCLLARDSDYTKVWNHHADAPYLYGKSGLWISYENPQSILAKLEFAKNWGVGGVMVYSIGNDDTFGKCGASPFPLLKLISKLAKPL